MAGIVLEPHRGRVRVTALGEVIADSADTIALHERGYEPVLYFPKADVRFDRLKPTARQTLCPHKGIASYWSIVANGQEIENAVWAYEAPVSTVAAIAGRVAFYADKVDSIEATA